MDPFCGKGSILAVANYLGLDAIGVEIRSTLCKKELKLMIDENNTRNRYVWRSSSISKGESSNNNNDNDGESNEDDEEESSPKHNS